MRYCKQWTYGFCGRNAEFAVVLIADTGPTIPTTSSQARRVPSTTRYTFFVTVEKFIIFPFSCVSLPAPWDSLPTRDVLIELFGGKRYAIAIRLSINNSINTAIFRGKKHSKSILLFISLQNNTTTVQQPIQQRPRYLSKKPKNGNITWKNLRG